MSQNPPMIRVTCVNLMGMTKDFYKDDDERQTYVVRKMLLTLKVVAAKQVIS